MWGGKSGAEECVTTLLLEAGFTQTSPLVGQEIPPRPGHFYRNVKMFDALRGEGGRRLEADFIIAFANDDVEWLEPNGSCHYSILSFDHGDDARLKKQQRHDEKRRKFAKETPPWPNLKFVEWNWTDGDLDSLADYVTSRITNSIEPETESKSSSAETESSSAEECVAALLLEEGFIQSAPPFGHEILPAPGHFYRNTRMFAGLRGEDGRCLPADFIIAFDDGSVQWLQLSHFLPARTKTQQHHDELRRQFAKGMIHKLKYLDWNCTDGDLASLSDYLSSRITNSLDFAIEPLVL